MSLCVGLEGSRVFNFQSPLQDQAYPVLSSIPSPCCVMILTQVIANHVLCKIMLWVSDEVTMHLGFCERLSGKLGLSFFFFEATGGDEHPLLIIDVLKNKQEKSLYKPTQDTKKERKKIKLSRDIIQSCWSIQLNMLYVLTSHGAKAVWVLSWMLLLSTREKHDYSGRWHHSWRSR